MANKSEIYYLVFWTQIVAENLRGKKIAIGTSGFVYNANKRTSVILTINQRLIAKAQVKYETSLFIPCVPIHPMLGLIPGLSYVLGATKPKDLGIKYTKKDFKIAREKGAVAWETISADGAEGSVSFIGSHDVNTAWDSTQMTSLLNLMTDHGNIGRLAMYFCS